VTGPPLRTDSTGDTGRWVALLRLAVAMFLAMTTWFSASAVVPQLRELWELGPTGASMLTIAVQLGFVAGALVSAIMGTADVFAPRRVMLLGAIGAAVANGALLVADSASVAIGLRFATGFFLAGVYPPGLKEMATWFRLRRGTALGVMVGALTLGSALPHLVNGLGGLDWRLVIATTSLLTIAGGMVAATMPAGPFPFPKAPFDPRLTLAVVRNRRLRLASYGYFGHMWELYAMWTWIGTFLASSFAEAGVGSAARWGAFATFAAIAAGSAGSVLGGVIADHRTRTYAAGLSMVLSGIAAATIGLLWSGPPALVVVAAMVWGFWVVADSAQFSTLAIEVTDPQYVGTAVTLQLAIGFVLTVGSIWLVPVLLEAWGFRTVFLVLVPGPLLGTIAMVRLARLQESQPATDGATA